MNVLLDTRNWHVDIYCAVCGEFVGHFDVINPELFMKLESYLGRKLPNEIAIEE